MAFVLVWQTKTDGKSSAEGGRKDGNVFRHKMVALVKLRKRNDFLSVAKGYKCVRAGVVLQAKPNLEIGDSIRFGFTVTKKVGNSVVRSFVKRRMKAIARQLLPEKGQSGFDYVFIGRYCTASRNFADLTRDFESALIAIHKQKRGNNER